MRKSRFSVEQITYALKQVATGVQVAEVCRKLGISEQTFYVWKKKYGGMGAVEARRVNLLKDENRRLKQLERYMADVVVGPAFGWPRSIGRIGCARSRA